MVYKGKEMEGKIGLLPIFGLDVEGKGREGKGGMIFIKYKIINVPPNEKLIVLILKKLVA